MMTTAIYNRQTQSLNPLQFFKKWLDNQEIKEENLARQIVKLIPSQCPFARQIHIGDRVLFSIPPLCKL
ncbi:MAG: Mo-dependent nitrogenase C-terminal domain-containing protein, partial [Xenococcaceae cyanobacterium]